MATRWMLYSHDALGLGHVRRSLAVAGAVGRHRPDATALLVTCSPVIDRLQMPEGLDYIKLPSARKTGNGRYVSRHLAIQPSRLQTLRRQLLVGAFDQFQPRLMVVDKSPAGLMGELGGVFELIESGSPRPRMVLAWRDILDSPEQVRAEWAQAGTLPLIHRWYEEIWVFGDPRVYDLRKECALPDGIAERVRFLGYAVPSVDPEAHRAAHQQLHPDGRPAVLVTVGGGEDGEQLVSTVLESGRRGLLPGDARYHVVLGPCMPAEVAARLRAVALPDVEIHRFVTDLAPWISAADAVLGMAGYNTAAEILGCGVPAVLVPRTHPRREQWLRSKALSRLGIVEHLEPECLTPRTVADAIARALRWTRPGSGARALSTVRPRRDGLQEAAIRFSNLLPLDDGSAVAAAGTAPEGEVA